MSGKLSVVNKLLEREEWEEREELLGTRTTIKKQGKQVVHVLASCNNEE